MHQRHGGPVSSLTLTTTDGNGFAFGNFTEVAAAVPEPASLLLLAGMTGLLSVVRRRA
ncbi:MAG TPA: PEP-CTERM sorting domain-containing protein [Acetobacteraceae bacterium]